MTPGLATPPAGTHVALPMPEPPWGADLGTYFVIIGLASGITLISWWLRSDADPPTDHFGRYTAWTALGVLGIASAILVADLGRPERFYLMLTQFSTLYSPISVGAKLIAAKTALLAFALYLLWRRRSFGTGGGAIAAGPTAVIYRALPPALGALSLGLAVYPAIVLARSWVSPLAATSGAALVFVVTALLMGGAAAALLMIVVPAIPGGPRLARVRRGLVALLCAHAVVLALAGLALYGQPAGESRLVGELLHGGAAPAFWGLVVGTGLALPLLGLTALSRRRGAVVVSAVAVIVGAAATRYLIFALR